MLLAALCALIGCAAGETRLSEDVPLAKMREAIRKQDADALDELLFAVGADADLVPAVAVLRTGLGPKNSTKVKEAATHGLIRIGSRDRAAYRDVLRMDCGRVEGLAKLRLEALHKIDRATNRPSVPSVMAWMISGLLFAGSLTASSAATKQTLRLSGN
jgi:hypothetical protein